MGTQSPQSTSPSLIIIIITTIGLLQLGLMLKLKFRARVFILTSARAYKPIKTAR